MAMSAKAYTALILAALLSIPATESCSCLDPGSTGAERADFIRNSDWISFVFLGRVLDEASYTTFDTPLDDDLEPYPFDFQNVTFSLNETLIGSTRSLPSSVFVGDDGAMMVKTHTETTCCLCGQSVPADDVGAEYLISMGGGGSLSVCNINCRTDWNYCADTVAALRSTEPPIVQAEVREVACQNEEACDRRRQELEISSFSAGEDYQSKGCFQKKGKAYWGRGGSEEDISQPTLPGIRQRIWCEETAMVDPPPENGDGEVGGAGGRGVCNSDDECLPTIRSRFPSKTTNGVGLCECYSASSIDPFDECEGQDDSMCVFSKCATNKCAGLKAYCMRTEEGDGSTKMCALSANTDTAPTPSPDEEVACLTKSSCDAKRLELGITSFSSGNYPYSGCFVKKGKAYWGDGGSAEDVSKSSLPGLVERLRCNREDNGNGNDNGTPESCQVGPAVDPASVFCAGGRKQFCQLDTGVCNNKSGIHTGTCKEIPDLCTEDYKPVCGCNEKTYSNECKAYGDGVSVSRRGICAKPSPSTNAACLTAEDCDMKRKEIGIEIFHANVDSSTKGCFTKNGKAFFSEGTEAEMSKKKLQGVQERIWCENNDHASDIKSLFQNADSITASQEVASSAVSFRTSIVLTSSIGFVLLAAMHATK